MYDPKKFREEYIIPACKTLDLYSKAAENLLLGTALQESLLTYVRQMPHGPALGFFQMEPETYKDCFINFLDFHVELKNKLMSLTVTKEMPDPFILVGNHTFAAAMCRIKYYRVPEKLPDEDDIEGLAKYWKKWYNSSEGAGEIEEFVEKYERFGLEL
jgi:hypothetical protein